jgi:hypothetical protein
MPERDFCRPCQFSSPAGFGALRPRRSHRRAAVGRCHRLQQGAPEEVLPEQREKRAEALALASRLKDAVARLAI